MINLIILEDELTYAEIIRTSVEELFPERFSINIFQTTAEVRNSGITPDVLISDIKLTDENAIDYARELSVSSPKTQIIFISAYHNYAQDIFEANPVYYIQKPINKDVLKTAITKAINKLSKEKDNLFVIKTGAEIISVPCGQIVLFESTNRKVTCITKENSYVFYGKLSEVEKKLDGNFLRCHQSFIINMNEIKSLTGTDVKLNSGKAIPISQNRQKEVREKYTMFLAKSI